MTTKIPATAALLGLTALACLAPVIDADTVAAAERAIRADQLLADIEALASDEMEGRAPGTAGEERALSWLAREMEAAGALPGCPNGVWLQEVPLVGFQVKPAARFKLGESSMQLAAPDDFVAISRLAQPLVQVSSSEVVFVGHGVVAPEYGWDDFKDVDVRGKTVLVLVGDPPVADPGDPERLDPELFRGEAMTYYGRWTYKYEVASERGAAACLIVHQTGPAGYPWGVVATGGSSEDFDLRGGGEGRVPVEAWITEDVARRLLEACGEDFETLARAARARDFQPVHLPARADFELAIERREAVSHNLAARIPGAGPRADEWIVYSAHWDHLGRDPALEGDQIFNGALDNATGTAALVALARSFAALPEPPPRSILLLAVTAEEKGLLGSRHYAAQPLYPLEKTLCDINMDGLNPWGRTRDVVSIGLGQTSLDALLEEEAARQGRVVVPDAEPAKGFFYRSDHFEFAKRGVPPLFASSGVEFRGRPQGWGRERRAEYTARDYHEPSDEVKPDWDLAGMVEDVRLYFRLGLRVAAGRKWPEWRPGTEFRAVRQAALAGAPGP